MKKLFLISPASTSGKRAHVLMRPEATFAVAQELREDGVSVDRVFTFLSGLYFRGKSAYAKQFSQHPFHRLIISAGQGLIPLEQTIDIETMNFFSRIDISAQNTSYIAPLEEHLIILKSTLKPDDQVILLGSVATKKYVEPLVKHLGSQVFFPLAFKGLGDMSRGSLLLKAVASRKELEYAPLADIDDLTKPHETERISPE